MFEKAIEIIMAEPPELHYPSYYADLLREKGSEKPNSSDLISRQAVIDSLYDWSNHTITDAETWHLRQVIGDIKSMKPAEPEREKGEWIPAFGGKFTGGAYWFECSKCKRIVPEVRNGGWNFCPSCGKDMRGKKKDD